MGGNNCYGCIVYIILHSKIKREVGMAVCGLIMFSNKGRPVARELGDSTEPTF